MSEEGTIQEAQEQVTEISSAKKATKQDLTRQKIYDERRQRHLNKGIPAERVDQVIAREDYERLSVEEKVKRLENNIGGALRQLAGELQNLRHNDGVIAEAMDVNFRALGKIFAQLGVSTEQQKAYLKDVAEEMQRERLAQQEQQAAEQALKEAPQEVATAPTVAPEAATSFGG